MLLKVVILSSATTSGWGDTSIAKSLDADLQVVIKSQLQLVLN